MKSVEMEGKTVDEAVFFALNAINLPIDKVNIEVLNSESKGGLFGIGAKRARVRLTEKPRVGGPTVAFVDTLLEKMGMDAVADASMEEDSLLITLKGEDEGSLIGYRGETLDAIQYLTMLAVDKDEQTEPYRRVIVDAAGYRMKRRNALEGLARKTASQVRRTGRKVTLEPMNPYERRILHSALQGNPYVTTESEGAEPNRRVVVMPK